MDTYEIKITLKNRESELVALMDKLSRATGKSDGSPFEVSENKDFVDIASDLTEREYNTTEMLTVANELSLVRHALYKLEKSAERYGICERCLRRIEVQRLLVKPWARYCKSCKENDEKNARTEK